MSKRKSHHTLNEQIQNKRQALQDQYNGSKVNRHVDFINALPYDVMNLVIDHLPFDAMLETLNVSRSWRDRIASCNKTWEKLELSHTNRYQIPSIIAALPYVGHHIQKLQLIYIRRDQCKKLFKSMTTGSYTRLTSLTLFRCSILDYRQCIDALRQVSATLEEIYFCSEDTKRNMIIPIGSVLSSCKRIKKFYCEQNISLPLHGLGRFPRKPVETLIDMTLKYKTIKPSRLQRILKLCPNLTRLSISLCDIPVIEVVQHVCPNLQYLGFNYEASPEDEKAGPQYDLSQGANPSSSPLLRHVRIDFGDDQILASNKPILRLLSDNASMIETLCFNFPDVYNNAEAMQWNPLSTISFDNIRYLSFGFHLPDLVNIVAKMLSHCHQVETLVLKGPEFVDDSMFHSISHHLGKLKTLEFFYNHFDERAMIGLDTMFRDFARNRASLLEKIVIYMPLSAMNDGTFLRSLSSISALQEIEFSAIGTSLASFQSFLIALATHRSCMLHSMTLRFMDCVDDVSLQHISKIQSLRTLALVEINNITSDGLEYIKLNKNIKLTITK